MEYQEIQNRVNDKLSLQKPVEKINYFPKFEGRSSSIVYALRAVGCNDTSLDNRRNIAVKNKIVPIKSLYKGTSSQNTTMLKLLKSGKLIKP